MALAPYESQIFSGTLNASANPLGQGQLVAAHRGVILNVHISAVNSPGTLDIKLTGRDAWANIVDIPGAALPQISTTGDYILYVGRDMDYVPNERIKAYLPAAIQVVTTLGGGGDFTGQVGLTFID